MEWQALRDKIRGSVSIPADSNFANRLEAMVWNRIKSDRSPEES